MLGENIRKYREQLGISQRELGRRVGKTGQFISLIEQGKSKPSIDVLEKIADAFVVSLDELLNDESTSFSSKLITAILRMEYITIVFDTEDDYGYATIESHTGISINSLKKCIEENTELKTQEQLKLIEFWKQYGCIDDGVELQDFLHDNFKEVNKNPLLSRKIKDILYINTEKDNKEKLLDLLESNGYIVNIESSNGITTVTISNECGTVSEMLEVDFFNFGNDLVGSIERFTRFSIEEFVKKHKQERRIK